MSKPSFLSNDMNDEETKNLAEAFEDTPQETPTEEQPKEEVKTEEQPKTEEVKEEVKTDDGTNQQTQAQDIEEKKDKVEEQKQEEQKVDVKQEEKKQEEPQKTEEKLILGKYKTQEDFEKAYKELESALGRANATITSYRNGVPAIKPGEKPTEIQQLMNTPMVHFKMPSTKDYIDNEGNLAVEEYMQDYSRNLILGIQQSMLTGPLAAAQFGILQQAMREEYDTESSKINSEREAQEITNKLYEEFPRIKDDKDLEDLVSTAIIGERTRRANLAAANNEEPKKMNYEDYRAIIKKIIDKTSPPQQQQKQDVVETMKQTPVMGISQQAPRSDIDKTIEGMSRAGGGRGSIF